ncbi:MAG: phosphoribosylglycinamide formyltransferase [Desulfovibrio sp.]|nr:phosphoribosylglycinamide formyltransferase [Desulfovibrio sp.]
MPLRLALLASGSGTNCQAIIDAKNGGLLDIEIGLVATNKPGAPVLERAARASIPHITLDHKTYENREDYDADMVRAIHEHGCEAVALAGYMLLVSPVFLKRFNGPVLNLHPAVLPSFPGLHGARDALGYGVKITGCTVHFVNEQMDNGPVIIQAAVGVRDDDTEESLLSRIHALEHRIYPQAVAWLSEGRLTRQGRRVLLAPKEGRGCAELPGDCLVWPPLEKGF